MQFKVEVMVEPDHYYVRFYESAIADLRPGQARNLLEKALDRAKKSSFKIYENSFPLYLLHVNAPVGTQPIMVSKRELMAPATTNKKPKRPEPGSRGGNG